MVLSSPPPWLSRLEFDEFNDITYDKIKNCSSIPKLKRLERYMREEGFSQTADVARQRIIDQGGLDSHNSEPCITSCEAENVFKSMHFWQADIKQKDVELQKLQNSKSKTRSNGAHDGVLDFEANLPEVRKMASGLAESDKGNKEEKPKRVPKKDIRSGREYYEGWDKYASYCEKENVEEKNDEVSRLANETVLEPAAEITERKAIISEAKPLVEREWLANREREKGNDLFKAKEFNASLQAYTKAINMYKGSAVVYANRAAVYLKMNRYEEAYADCNEALKFDPQNVKALMRRAKASLEMGVPTKAFKDMNEALKLDPTNEEVIRLKRISEEASKKCSAFDLTSQASLPGGRRISIEEVEGIAETHQIQNPGKLDPIDKDDQKDLKLMADEWRVKGNMFFTDGKFEKAYECYTKSLIYVPENVVVLSNRSLCQLKLKNYEAAEMDASTALALDSSFVKAFRHRGLAQRALGRLEEAIEDLQKVLSAVPGDKRVAFELKMMKMELNNDRLLLPKREGPMIIEEIHEDMPPVYTQKSFAKDNSSHVQSPTIAQRQSEAKPCAFDLEGDSPIDLGISKSGCTEKQHTAVQERMKGNTFFNNGQYEAAIDLYSKSLELDQMVAATYTNRALCHLKLKRPEKAINDCTQAIFLEPLNRKAYFRRATSRQQIKDLCGALEDFKVLMSLCPDDETVKTRVEELELELHGCTEENRIKEEATLPCDTSDKPVEVLNLKTILHVSEVLENQDKWKTGIVPSTPKTSLEFERSCLSLLRQPLLLKKYIQNIRTNLYPTIFKEDLTARLMKLVGAFLKENLLLFEPKEILQVLQGFTRVNRFKIVMMLLEPCDREVFKTLFDSLVALHEIFTNDVMHLRFEYMCS